MVHPLTKNKICLKYFILIIVLSCFFLNYLNPYSCFHIQYFLNKHWDKKERKAAESAAVITLSEVRVKLWTQSKLSVSPEDTRLFSPSSWGRGRGRCGSETWEAVMKKFQGSRVPRPSTKTMRPTAWPLRRQNAFWLLTRFYIFKKKKVQ